MDAAFLGNVEAVNLLLEAQASLSATDKDGVSALHWAVRKNHTAVVRVLLCAGHAFAVSLDLADNDGNKPLMFAAVSGFEHCLEHSPSGSAM